MSDNIKILKSNGQLELFNREKLRNSLKKSGASSILANEISDKIESELKNGIETSKIYKRAYEILNQKSKKTALRYSIRRKLSELGPTGFPFEKYIAKIMNAKGYKTQTGIMLVGKCIEHEIDVLAYDIDDLLLIEAKYHNEINTKTDTKVTLYIKARFDDLSEQEFLIEGKKRKMTNGLLITNTKFTENAKKYAKCANLDLISWDYPEKGNLYELIESTEIYPEKDLDLLNFK
ncbi:MAG TPA: restriction endonuclease [Candidatus Paceibacterota bacterium]|nr:restriction endonuclease [Candidatus Paceibacterota bacterium]HMP18761.1 restriction endonuclease [Candidatus Paceibacterota bacterium]HMP85322.1 restriction endonuclease [Candidatus Paceibacterota bacterium]